MKPNELNEKQLDSITAAGGVSVADLEDDTLEKYRIITDEEKEELKKIFIDEIGIEAYEKYIKIITEQDKNTL